MPLSDPNELPTLEVTFTVFEVDPLNQIMKLAPVAPNPTNDLDKAKEICKMLSEATGNKYAVMQMVQSWVAASFEFTEQKVTIQ